MSELGIDASSEAKKWENIWGSTNILHVFLNAARKVYSKYFFFLLKPYMPNRGSFLEIGSGSGILVMKFAGAGYTSVGIDISEQAIVVAKNEAKKNHSSAEFILGDCYKLPFKEGRFDIVWSQGVLEELERPKDCLKEQYRVLKKNGVILASVPAKYSWLWVWRQLTKNKLFAWFWPWPDHLFYEREPLLALGRQISKGATVRNAGPLKEVLVLEIRKK